MLFDPFHAQDIHSLINQAHEELQRTGTVSAQTQASLNQVGYEFKDGKIQAQGIPAWQWALPAAAVGGAMAIPALFGGGGGAAAGAGASGAAGGVGIGETGAVTGLAGSGFGGAAGAATLPSVATAPFAGALPGGAASGSVPAATAGATGVGGILKAIASHPDLLKALAAGGVGLAARATAPQQPDLGSNSAVYPQELKDLLAMAISRMKDQQPLADAVNRQSLAGLPSYAKGGG
jgi:hypothetical protein